MGVTTNCWGFYSKNIWPYGIDSGCFQLHACITKLKPSLTRQSCGDSMPDVCFSRQDGAISTEENRPQ